jgi:hypothetical protein
MILIKKDLDGLKKHWLDKTKHCKRLLLSKRSPTRTTERLPTLKQLRKLLVLKERHKVKLIKLREIETKLPILSKHWRLNSRQLTISSQLPNLIEQKKHKLLSR